MSAKCTVLIGSDGNSERVEVSEKAIGRVQVFLQKTGFRFQNRTQLARFVDDGVIPEGAKDYCMLATGP